MHATLQTLVALAALLGTGLQTREALQQLREHPDIDVFRAVDDWQREVPPYRPLRRRRHKQALREVRRDHPEQWRRYRRLERILLSWSFLDVAALAALIDTLR